MHYQLGEEVVEFNVFSQSMNSIRSSFPNDFTLMHISITGNRRFRSINLTSHLYIVHFLINWLIGPALMIASYIYFLSENSDCVLLGLYISSWFATRLRVAPMFSS